MSVEGRAEAGLGAVVDTNVHRTQRDPETGIGPSTFGRLGVAHEEPWLEIEARSLFRLDVLFAAGEQPVATQGAGRVRVELGPQDVASFALALTGGWRTSEWTPLNHPEGQPAALLTLPEGDDFVLADFGRLHEHRAALRADLQARPLAGMQVRGFGGLRMGRHSAFGSFSAWADHYDGGGGVEVRGALESAPVELVFRAAAAQESLREVIGLAPVGSPEPGWEPLSFRAGGVFGATIAPSEAVRVDAEGGWTAVALGESAVPSGAARPAPSSTTGPSGIRRSGWVLGPEGIVGRVRARLEPAAGVVFDVGLGRTVDSSPGILSTATPVARTTAWFRLEGDLADRIRPWGEVRWVHGQELGWDVTRHFFTGAGGADVRLGGALWLRADGRVAVVNPSSNNAGEYIAGTVWLGLVVRPAGQEPFPRARW